MIALSHVPAWERAPKLLHTTNATISIATESHSNVHTKIGVLAIRLYSVYG